MAKKKSRITRPRKPKVLANNADPRPVKRRQPKKKTKKTGKSSGARVKPHHVHAVCSYTNPFCPAAKGSKWPDGTAGNTLTEQFRRIVTVSTDAAGSACMVFAAAAPYGYIGSSITTGTATFASTYGHYGLGSMLSTYGADYRIVSFGVIVRCVASATNAAGVVTLGTAPPPAISTTNTMGEMLYLEQTTKAIQPGLEISWIATPTGSGARTFVAQSDTTTGVSTVDWNACWLEISGATVSIPLLTVEVFCNVEFQPKVSARTLAKVAHPNPPKSAAAEQAVSKVHSTLGSFIEGGVRTVEDTVQKAATNALKGFMDDPLESIAGLFGML